jgi:hypothetical protein
MAGWVVLLIGLVLGIGVVVVALWIRAPEPPARRKEAKGTCAAAELEFIAGPLEGQVLALDAEVTTLGTAGSNTIVLADAAVSRKHAGIRRGPDGFELADLGSQSGVFVNGQRAAKRLLAAGDIIRIGASEMVFRIEKVG